MIYMKKKTEQRILERDTSLDFITDLRTNLQPLLDAGWIQKGAKMDGYRLKFWILERVLNDK